MIDLDDEAPRSTPAALALVKRWVRSACQLGDEAVVLVTELRCHEPGCPPVETVVAIMAGPGRRWDHRFHKPADAIAWHEVLHAARLWDDWLASGGARPDDSRL
jgi:hypothetical protein